MLLHWRLQRNETVREGNIKVVKVKRDLTNLEFGRLKVICQVDDYVSPSGRHQANWLCSCSCKENRYVTVRGCALTRKNCPTLSCGCLNIELSTKRLYKYSKKYNDYEVQEDYVIMYTSKGESFLIDLDDFWKVKDLCWYIANTGYVASNINGKGVLLHRIIMDCQPNETVDHIGGNDTKTDCRKCNLRIVNRSENGWNRTPTVRNKSGTTGVRKTRSGKWSAFITEHRRRHYLGTFNTKEEAIVARKEAELKYCEEYSYDRSQEIWRGLN